MKSKILKSLVALTMIFSLCFGSSIEAKANCISSGWISGACVYIEFENVPCDFADMLNNFVIQYELAAGCWD